MSKARATESSSLDRLKTYKLWGHEDTIHNADGYCGKLLHLLPNQQCSLHFHAVKHETFTAIDGEVWVEYYPFAYSDGGGDDLTIDKGPATITLLRGWAYDALELPPFTPHRFWTTNPNGAILAEFSTPHADEDVVRLEDSRPLPQ